MGMASANQSRDQGQQGLKGNLIVYLLPTGTVLNSLYASLFCPPSPPFMKFIGNTFMESEHDRIGAKFKSR